MKTLESEDSALWITHLKMQSDLHILAMQILADRVLSNPDPLGPFQKFSRLWQRYVESGEHLKNVSPPKDTTLLEKLKEGSAALMRIMASIREEAAQQMHQTRQSLLNVRGMETSKSIYGRKESRGFRRQV